MTEEVKVDTLVIGSGIAGLFFALRAARLGSVLIITKKEQSDSNTNWAQGGIAAVLAPDDRYELHIADTLEAGAGLCNREAVEVLVKEGPEHVRELIAMGVQFTMKDGEPHLVREGGHSKNRILHAADLTGREIERALLAKVAETPNITLWEHHIAIELITEHHLRRKTNDITCYGAYALDTKTGRFKKILSRFTMLATGGCGQVYQHTTNPEIATGDGIAMAYRAGAEIHNMEFIQFHPTSLYHPKAKSFLISEAVRGFGGILRNSKGEAFMARYDARKELAPRDIVARAIDSEMKKLGDECVYLDITHKPASAIKEHFPNIYERCLMYGIDITQELIPVVPAMHYSCGGVATDLFARTTLNRLYASGEAACTGVHGANRLASNSLLEALVFSHRAYLDLCQNFKSVSIRSDFPDWDESGTESPEEWVLISHNRKEVQQVMNDYVGIVRSDLRLERARRRIEFLKEETEAYYKRTKVSEGLLELRNIIKVAKLIIESAIKRRESRGLHYTTDYPYRDDKHYLRNTVLRSF
ncbi:MAG: L-aspartate oxidase [Chloroherpetonaceae bacterium]|nr:L-aspartate oxidase [Chloroherpetonaceae bacterium]MCS7210828.1 L-aspartate oxidase [Chloroherpetonaceae bacterium]MDW8020495.1 L-aspartate oxidase [Chloroherpetonaceae bacterium]MDW8465367.1 L-aspartate oxidase [Chloroherpetonaceae bacterium]